MPITDVGLLEMIKAEVRSVASKYGKMNFFRRIQVEESEEISDTISTFRMRIDRYADMFQHSSEFSKEVA